MPSRAPHATAILLLTALLCATPSSAQRNVAAVGSEGEVYTVLEGSYSDLFPEQGLTEAGNAVLALEIALPDGDRSRLLIPGTGTSDIEDSASVVFEDGSETLFVLWQTKINLIHSNLKLASFKDGEWSQVVEIWGSPFGWKSSPQLLVSRDLYKTVDDVGEQRIWNRAVAHVIWSEERADGFHTLYSPIVLIDGAYLGETPVYDLSDVAVLPEEAAPGSIARALAGSSRIRVGRNAQTVVVGFSEPSSGRLVSLELEVLPGELVHLADRIGHQIIEIGRELYPGQPDRLADRLGHQIIEIGNRLDLHPGLAAYSAAVVENEVVKGDPDRPLDVLADELGHQIIEIGARMTGRGVDRVLNKSGYHLLEIPSATPATGVPDNPSSLIRAATVTSRPAPRIEQSAPSSVDLFLSRTGVDIIAVWRTD
ncbi:MAG: hypothetical protein PVG07_00235, partial [Acidobacteriota bacterium]